ncbi:helix-turn-helix domain-containing protein [Saccharopolyspora dendranthemae]|nr:helix-turn-helix domain-containing protein [Saccharopolyspora dendranthemae]
MTEGELGAFLRSRRESVSPERVGLPSGSRRRTPGLRRAELATLAGISVEYLTRLEQGRDKRPSGKVLTALAEALRLSDEEIGFLNQLAVAGSGTELSPRRHQGSRVVTRSMQAILRQLEPAPCFVVNHMADLLAWTDGYDRLVRPLGVFEADEPNLIWFTLTDSRARTAYPDWERVADEHVADLHELRRGDPEVDAFVERLSHTAGEEFTRRWGRRPVGARRTGNRTLEHPEVGTLTLSFETMRLADDLQRLIVLLPGDMATETKLNRLSGYEAGLRVVSAG